MLFVKVLLLPFSLIYQLVTTTRNYLYELGWWKSSRFGIATICVGNLSVGGTGKTPMVEYLIRLFQTRYRVATLSRGYGRKSKGFMLAKDGITMQEIGDEPYQYFTKFKKQVKVSVGEKRAAAIHSLLAVCPDTQMVLLDDAFQHRAIACDVNILLTDYNHIFYKDVVLPAGRLRESRYGAARADVVVVTKCPEQVNDSEMTYMVSQVKKYARPEIPVFFTHVRYGRPLKVYEYLLHHFHPQVFLFTGIARPNPLREYISNAFQLIGFKQFPDHHDYSGKDLEGIIDSFHQVEAHPKCLVTTEKDMVKLLHHPQKDLFRDVPIFYIPIEIGFNRNRSHFDEIVLKSIEKKNN